MSNLIFIVQYILFVYGKHTLIYAIPQSNNFDLLVTYIKVFINYSLFSDPFIWIMLVPFGFFRAFNIIVNQSKVCISDQCLFAACAYSFSYFIIGVYGPYYLLPAYIFAIPTLYKVIKFYANRNIFIISTIILSLLNSIPYSLHSINYGFVNNLNFNKSVNYLTSELNKKENRTSIFIGEESQSRGHGNFWLIAGFLYFNGIGPDKFDLKIGEKIINEEGIPLFANKKFSSKINYDKFQSSIHMYQYYPFTVFDFHAQKDIPVKDDLVIFGPFSGDTMVYPNWFRIDEYNEIKFNSGFYLPDFSLKSILKNNLYFSNYKNAILKSKNIRKFPQYVIYVKK
jgi:hypothetical protein